MGLWSQSRIFAMRRSESTIASTLQDIDNTYYVLFNCLLLLSRCVLINGKRALSSNLFPYSTCRRCLPTRRQVQSFGEGLLVSCSLLVGSAGPRDPQSHIGLRVNSHKYPISSINYPRNYSRNYPMNYSRNFSLRKYSRKF